MGLDDGFNIGPVRIYYYSLSLALAVWLGYRLLIKNAARQGLTTETVTDMMLIVMVAGVLGARAGYVLQNLGHFAGNWMEIILVNSGGLSIHGAIIAAGAALFYFARRKKISFLKVTDLFVFPLLAGQIIGRLGNFFNQETYGYPTNLPWKIAIEPSHRLAGYFDERFYHPVFAYEMILLGFGWLVLTRIPKLKIGQLTAGYLIVWSISRFIVEFWRISDRIILGLSLAQLVSLAILSLGIWLYLNQKSKPDQPHILGNQSRSD